MGARAILKLQIQFGRLAIPVGLVPVKRDPGPELRTLHRGCLTPVSLLTYCKRDEVVVEQGDTIHAFELAEGEYLPIDDQELDALAQRAGRTIELAGTVDSGELDPVWIRGSYYLAASPLGRKPYRLLHAALAESGTVALGRYTAWDSEHLCAIAPRADGLLLLQNLYFAGDRRDDNRADLLADLAGTELDQAETGAAAELALALRRPLRRIDQGSRRAEQLQALLTAKLAGDTIVRPDGGGQLEQPPLPLADFTETLQQSVRDLRRRPRRPKPAGARE